MTFRYRPIYNCATCGMKWKGAPVKAQDGVDPDADAAYRVAMHGTPKCPNLDCGTVNVPLGMDLSLNKAPATVGQNIGVKAIDETAKIVMQDYGMTDMRTDVRMGETAAPKLHPSLQAQADGFFGGNGRRQMAVRDHSTGRVVNMRSNPRAMGMAAIRGAYRQPSDAAPTVEGLSEALRPPVNVIAAEKPRRG